MTINHTEAERIAREIVAFQAAHPQQSRNPMWAVSLCEHYLDLSARVKVLAANQRTPGTAEVCELCGERENGEAWEYSNGGSPWKECPQKPCHVARAQQETRT